MSIILKSKCAHPECTEMKLKGFYACAKHWFQLPKPIRDDIARYAKDRSQPEYIEAINDAQNYWGGGLNET